MRKCWRLSRPVSHARWKWGVVRAALACKSKDKLGAETWGVEYQPDAANLAAQKLHRVLAGSVESALPDLPL
ncbi:MAG: hypothetical protein Q8L02_01000, partial [Candidatus Nitrotoga sp.]|nr:hypothetical protein [Candidatus Nitrotoga sp.]